jgi:hemerythrin-like metal-binding protein
LLKIGAYENSKINNIFLLDLILSFFDFVLFFLFLVQHFLTFKTKPMNKDLIIWSEGYSVHIPEIDEQHKNLVALINRLYNAYLNKKHQSEISQIIKELKEYAFYHFSTEEKLFEKHNYAEKVEHIAMHNSFIDEINQLVKNHESSSLVLTMKTMTFLQRWLTNHILKEDKKYVGKI